MIPWEAQQAVTQTALALAEGFCEQKAILHHDLNTEGIHFLLWTGLNVGTVYPRDATC